MISFLEALKAGPVLADGGIGSYIFEMTGRLSELGHVYEAFNIDRPDIVRLVHLSYLQVGAQCLTTNTYEANRTHLSRLNEAHRTRAINQAAVTVARDAIDKFRHQTNATQDLFILGSCGPTLEGRETPGEIRDIYREQLEALIGAGVDALLLETFTSLPHLMALLEMLRDELQPHPPIIAQMALHRQEASGAWEQDPVVFLRTVAELGANVIGVNACSPWEATAFVEAVQSLELVKDQRVFLSTVPNAGRIDLVSHRYMTGVNPEVMGKFAREVTDRGARLVGGCSEVHPPFIAEMSNYLQSRQTGKSRITLASIDLAEARTPAGRAEKLDNGRFSRKVLSGEFAVSVELLPSRGTSPEAIESKAAFVAGLAAANLADAVDITDGSRGIPLMPPGDFIQATRALLKWHDGDKLELIPHFTGRDLNVMGIQSRLIGYHAQRIHNVMFITGDPPKMSPTYPRSTAVFDLDSAAMIAYTHACLNAGVDFGGASLGKHADPRTHFTIGAGFEPEAINSKRELDKLQRKIDGGIDYVMTQPSFRPEPLDILTPFRDRTAILVGVMILTSLEQARRVGSIPGVVIPASVIDRIGRFSAPADQARAGREFAAEQIRWVREQGWAGIYLMSPSSHQPVIEVLRAGLT